MIAHHIPRTIRLRLFKIVHWFEQVRSVRIFLENEWRESWEMYGWQFAFGDYATKIEFWRENAQAFGEWIEKRAYKIAKKKLYLR